MINHRKVGFIPFWFAAMFLVVTTCIGYEITEGKTDFYESKYVGELIKNGKAIEDSKLSITIRNNADIKDYQTTEFDFFVQVDPVGSMKVMNAMGYDKAGFYCDFESRDKTASAKFAVTDAMAGEVKRVIHLKADNEFNRFCRKITIVYSSFDDALMQLGEGTLIRLKRVPLHDELLLDHQRERYASWLKQSWPYN